MDDLHPPEPSDDHARIVEIYHAVIHMRRQFRSFEERHEAQGARIVVVETRVSGLEHFRTRLVSIGSLAGLGGLGGLLYNIFWPK